MHICGLSPIQYFLWPRDVKDIVNFYGNRTSINILIKNIFRKAFNIDFTHQLTAIISLSFQHSYLARFMSFQAQNVIRLRVRLSLIMLFICICINPLLQSPYIQYHYQWADVGQNGTDGQIPTKVSHHDITHGLHKHTHTETHKHVFRVLRWVGITLRQACNNIRAIEINRRLW